MVSKLSTTFGLSSASIAASESEFSISSSSKSDSAAASPGSLGSPSSSPCAGAAAGAALNRAAAIRRRCGRNRLTIGADRRRLRVLGVRTGVGGLEIDDVAEEDFSVVELVAPDDDGLEGERALAQPGDHRLAAGLDALGDGDFAFAGEKLHRAHLAQIHAHGIVGALGRLFLFGGGERLCRDLDELAGLF